jgi:predicted dehydrogenase/threonine dehydrogenase-like Zn-dependent dehydrogenase
MKQVVQNLGSGVLELLDVPCPQVSRGHLLIQSRASLVSAGTERMLVEFGRSSLLNKARQQPDRVKQVLDKVRSDGLLPTIDAVRSKLDDPLPLGYCNAGVVVEVGEGAGAFCVGDRVVSNGPHAEMVLRPVNLCAHIPPQVSDQQAAFTVLSSISLQGIRLLQPTIGERVAVFGLGLVGLLTVQMLVANGVQVLGIDLDEKRLALAEQFGATVVHLADGKDAVKEASAFTAGVGTDGVIIAASAKNDDILMQAAKMSRQRGRIVLVGVVNTKFDRAEFFAKELTFQVSCSYGPGRNDPAYEQQGIDYPLPFVRWTEQRNFQAVLQLLADGKLDVEPLITTRLPHAEAQQAYDALAGDRDQLGIVFDYPDVPPPTSRIVVSKSAPPAASAAMPAANKPRIGVIGAGNFTRRVLLPAMTGSGGVLQSIVSAGGLSAAHAARKFGFASCGTDYREMLADDSINTVFITTRHDLHAPMVVEALKAGKHVFVEKPLAIDAAGLDEVRDALQRTSSQQLMVGYNRRFSPHARKMEQLLAGRSEPLCMTMSVNAGQLPADHWFHDRNVGGGAIHAEIVHWIDLMGFLAASPIVAVGAISIGDMPSVLTRDDKISIALSHADGSLSTVLYYSNGHRSYPKETLEIYSDGRVLRLDNFRRLQGHGWSGFKRMNLWRQDKGHRHEVAEFVSRVAAGGQPVIPPQQLWNVTEAALAAEQSLREQRLVQLND